jgi:glucarate dehydratase
MRISRLRATPVNIPLEAPLWWAGGLYPGTSKVVIELETDAGIVGLGEAPSTNLLSAVLDMGERLVGLDPLDGAACEERCVPPWQIVQNTDDSTSVRAFGSIELALWDIRGKAWNAPLYQLLGGAVRREIVFTEYFGFRQGREMTPEAVVDYCLRMRAEHGSTCFEGKLSLGDPRLEVETVRQLREALGAAAVIRLDANMQHSLSTARRLLSELEPFNVRNYEDPVATFEELRVLRQHSTIPFSSHVPDLRRAVSLGVPDAFVINFAALGGIARTIRFIGACESMGVGFWCYSGDTGIATAAYLHVSAAMPWITEPSQSLCRWQIADVIEDGPFRQRNNVVKLPEGPGLGVRLDCSSLERLHQDFLKDGPIDHFHDPLRPGAYRRLPLA